MAAPRVRRHGWRCHLACRLALPAWILLGSIGWTGPEPDPPDPASGPPAAAPPPAPDPIPAREPTPPRTAPDDAPRPDSPAPDRPPRGPRLSPAPPPVAANAPAADRPVSPPGLISAPDLTVALVADPRLAEQFRSRRSLNHVLYRDRRFRLLLQQAQASLAQGQPLTAFDLLAELSAANEDVFLWDEETSAPVSARTSARRVIATFTADDRDRYERYLGTAATAALEAALGRGDSGAIQAVARRYPGTAAAGRAARLTATQLLDAGRAAEAVAVWRTLIDDEGLAALSDRERLLAAGAARLAGDADLIAQTTRESTRPIPIGQDSLSLTAWLDLSQTPEEPAPFISHAHWTVAAGTIAGSRASAGTAPYHRPLWSQGGRATEGEGVPRSLLPAAPTDAAAGVESAFAAWREDRWVQGEIPATAASPVVTQGRVIVREFASLAARELSTGRLVWRHPCRTGLDNTATSAAPHAFTPTCAENALLLTLSSDGRRLFYIDSLGETPLPSGNLTDASDAAGTDADESLPTRLVNRLVAIELPHEQPASHSKLPTAWTHGSSDSGVDDSPLAGHFFLGCPTPVDGGLLVLTESAGQINLVGLDAATGAVEFVQGLALVDRPLTADSDRLRLSFLPAVRNGLAVCPTPCGAVVAVDLTTRSLAWTAQYRPLDTAVSTSWRGDGRSLAALHAVQPVLSDDQVLLLPPDGVELIALELRSGARLWTQPRRGGNQVCLTADDRALLLSVDRATCLDLATGECCWERSLDGVAGRAVVIGETLLVPLAAGGMALHETRTGEPLTGGPEILAVAVDGEASTRPLLSASRNQSSESDAAERLTPDPCGNLAACGDWVISTSPLHMTVFLSAGRLLAELTASERTSATSPRDPTSRQLCAVTARWSPAERALHRAELELTLSRAPESLPHLLAVTESAGEVITPSDTVAARAETLLQEVLYSRLESGASSDPTADLARLTRLAQTESEQARVTLAVLRHAADVGDSTRWFAAAAILVDLPSDRLAPADVGRARQLHPAVTLPGSWQTLLSHVAPDERRTLQDEVARRWESLATTRDPIQLDGLVRTFGAGRDVDRARIQLARQADAAGDPLAAQMLLLAIRRHHDSPLGRSAQRLLGGLDDSLGLSPRADARDNVALAEFVPQPRGARRESPEVITAAYRSDHPAFGIAATWLMPQAPQVTIEVLPLGPDDAHPVPTSAELFDARRELLREPSSPLRILNVGDATEPSATTGGPEPPPQVALALIRRDSAELAGRILIPARSREPLLHFQPEAGHFLPVADHEVHGLCLLTGDRRWTVALPGADPAERVRLGPCSANFCIVQTTSGLVCLDPLTGAVRWQRRDVSADSGLYANEETGLFGDAERLVLVEGDQRSCRIFATATGELLRTAILPTTDVRRSRLACGSRLAFVTGGEESPRFRLWDAATDALLVDEPACYPFRMTRVDRRHVAYVSAAGDVTVLNIPAADVVLRHSLPASALENLTGVSVWHDPEHWFVQTSHSGLMAAGRVESAAGEVQIPSVTVNGLVSAYDRRGSRLLWSRPLENRTLLTMPHTAPPFLVALSRAREGLTAQSSGLNVEVIDAATGHQLAQTHVPAPTRTKFIHAAFDASQRQVSLFSELQRIDIRYAMPRTTPLMTAENDTATIER